MIITYDLSLAQILSLFQICFAFPLYWILRNFFNVAKNVFLVPPKELTNIRSLFLGC
jgi:hypothetical protein